MAIKELYTARLTLMNVRTKLEMVVRAVTPERAEEIYVAEVVEDLYNALAKIDNRILKIENDIKEEWNIVETFYPKI